MSKSNARSSVLAGGSTVPRAPASRTRRSGALAAGTLPGL